MTGDDKNGYNCQNRINNKEYFYNASFCCAYSWMEQLQLTAQVNQRLRGTQNT